MKSKLRHPINSIREPFGTAGLIVAMIALVAALGGTAFAAAKLNSTQKKEVEKIAKKYAGKPGANGANGTNGSPGAKGDAGAAGSNGTNGTNGTNGESVTVTTIPTSSATECNHLGGAKFTNGTGTAKVCNGTTGFTKTLPSKETETGTWTLGPNVKGSEPFVMRTALSLPIPLAAPIATSNVIIFEGTTIPAGCSGTVNGVFVSELKADPGNLCVWDGLTPGFAEPIPATELQVHNQEDSGQAFGTHGGVLTTTAAVAEFSYAEGIWAVTAP